jgi:hypothetical protein
MCGIRQARNLPDATYFLSNEQPEAVVHGLGIEGGEEVLSILGSGDIPLALALEHATVTAVDTDIEQLQLWDAYTSYIKEESFTQFYDVPHNFKKGVAFLMKRRQRFDERSLRGVDLERISVQEADVRYLPSNIATRSFDAVYLSNAVSGCDHLGTLGDFIHEQPSGTSVYTVSKPYHTCPLSSLDALVVDEERTRNASLIEAGMYGWEPHVYRKE